MLAIEKARAMWRRAPRVSLIGAVLMVVAAVSDVTVHLAAAGHHQHGAASAHGAHLLGLAGMVLVLVGIAAFAIRRSPGRHASPSLEGPHDAHR